MTIQSIITGDFIGSVKADTRQLQELLYAMAHDLQEELYEIQPLIYQYRGDGFQLVAKAPERGIRLMLLVRAWLAWRSHALVGVTLGARLFLGHGQVTLLDSLGASGGEGFTLSGRGLDALKKPYTMGVATYQSIEKDLALRHLVILLDEISSRWKPKQAEAMFYLLKGYTYTHIAQERKKSAASIGQAAKSAGWPRLADSIIFMETLLT